jgi:hypothetical protein
MKIAEITEGYIDTQEGWGEFKSAVGRGARAVTGVAGRQMRDVGNTAMAKMGSGQAQGKKEMQRVVGGVIKNFNRYVGQSGGKPTVGALKQYLTALGIQNPVMERRGIMPQKAQNLRNRMKGMPKPQKPQTQQPAQQAPAAAGRKDTDVLTRNDLFDIIGKNIQQAMQAGTLPKELQKFLGP